jgi:hypothetical protein
MAQTCSPCSVPLCGKTVTKTRLELNAEVMVIIIIIIINITVILSYVQAKKKLNIKEGRGFESASQCVEIDAPICFL